MVLVVKDTSLTFPTRIRCSNRSELSKCTSRKDGRGYFEPTRLTGNRSSSTRYRPYKHFTSSQQTYSKATSSMDFWTVDQPAARACR